MMMMMMMMMLIIISEQFFSKSSIISKSKMSILLIILKLLNAFFNKFLNRYPDIVNMKWPVSRTIALWTFEWYQEQDFKTLLQIWRTFYVFDKHFSGSDIGFSSCFVQWTSLYILFLIILVRNLGTQVFRCLGGESKKFCTGYMSNRQHSNTKMVSAYKSGCRLQ